MMRDSVFRTTRRDVLVGSAVGLSAGLVPRLVHAGSDATIRIGLVGCGGRGTGAAMQAVAADDRVRIVAMGDLFPDAVEESHGILSARIGGSLDCPRSRRFAGIDAFEGVLAERLDVVILASPPAFRAGHAARAIERGVHVYAERPLSVDGESLAAVGRCGLEAARKGLSFMTSLPLRHVPTVSAAIEDVRAGRIGRAVSAGIVETPPQPWGRSRRPEWTAEEHRLRNWVSEESLSGGPIVERFMDTLDLALSALGAAAGPFDAAVCHAAERGGSYVRLRCVDGREIRLEVAERGGPQAARVAVAGDDGRIELVARRARVSVPEGFDRAWRTLLGALARGEAVNDCREACLANAAAIACREAVLAAGPSGSLSRIAGSKHPAWS